MTGTNNPTPTISLSSTLAEMLQIAVKNRESHQIARFDMGQGREVAFIAIAEDSYGYLNALLTYQDSRDRYATRVANAVAEDIAKNGLPEPGTSFNLIQSSDGEGMLPPEEDGGDSD